MSIFLNGIGSKPASYTKDLKGDDRQWDYESLKKEIRGKVYDNFKDFEKIGGLNDIRQSPKRPQSQAGLHFQRNSQQKQVYSPLRENKIGSSDLQNGGYKGFLKGNNITAHSSPMKISGLQKQMSSLGNGKNTVQDSTKKTQFQSHFENLFTLKPTVPQVDSSKNSTYRPQSSVTNFSNFRLSSPTTGFPSQQSSSLSQVVPIQKLVEIQNLLEMTPSNELCQLPRHYLDELLRVAQAITRTLKYHHDQQRLKL